MPHTSLVHFITISLNFSHSFSTLSTSPPLDGQDKLKYVSEKTVIIWYTVSSESSENKYVHKSYCSTSGNHGKNSVGKSSDSDYMDLKFVENRKTEWTREKLNITWRGITDDSMPIPFSIGIVNMELVNLICHHYTLSGPQARWLPRMLRLHVRFPLRMHCFILCTRRWGSTAHEGGGCDQSIESTVSDAIIRSWLWLTATRSSPFGWFSTLLQVVDNWPHILW